jgi:thioredoxin-dependent peroxiredoxin
MQLRKDDEAPDFALQDQEGQTVRLSDYRGKAVPLYLYPKAGPSTWSAEKPAARLLCQRFLLD